MAASTLVGKHAMVTFDRISVLCLIADSRQAYGRTDVLVQPDRGEGQQWVGLSRIRLLPDSRQQ